MYYSYELFMKRRSELEGDDTYIYYRVSTKPQGKGTSLKEQKRMCTEGCKELKLNILEEFEEKASAMKSGKRPKFKDMVQKLKDGKAKVLVCAFPDRLTRNGTDADIIKELIEDFGITVLIVSAGKILQAPVDPIDFFQFDLDVAVSNYRVRLDQIRCQIGREAKNRSGFRAAPSPYGYANEDGVCLIVRDRAEFVQKAFELYATGNYSTSRLPDVLFELGYRYDKQEDEKIPKQSLINMLQNEFYTGKYLVDEETGFIEGNHKPIITNELFDMVQSQLKVAPQKSRKYNMLYSKLLSCVHCGALLTQETKTNSQGKTYYYYRCKKNKCENHPSVKEVDLDTEVAKYLKELRLELIPDEIVQTVLTEELYPLTQELAKSNRAISRKFHEKLHVDETLSKKGIDDEQYREARHSQIDEKYGDLDSKIYCTQKQIDMIHEKVEKAFKKRVYDLYKTYDNKTKRTLLELFADTFKVASKEFSLTFKSAFDKIRRR